jgi:hypothetical protein
MIRFYALLFAVVMSVFSCGCSMFESACAKAIPAITASQIYTDDLLQWVGDIRQRIATLPLPPDKLATIQTNLDKITAIARSAYDLEAAAITTCSAPTIASLFGAAGPLIRDVIALTTLFAAGPNSRRVPEPLVLAKLNGG